MRSSAAGPRAVGGLGHVTASHLTDVDSRFLPRYVSTFHSTTSPSLKLCRIYPNSQNLSSYWWPRFRRKLCALFRSTCFQSVMADSGSEETGKPGKRKAMSDNLGGEQSSWRREGGEEFHLAAEDPLLVFGLEIMTIILGKLDVRSVAEARLVSRGWQAVASSDRIWGPKCRELWLGKAHIPRISMVEGLPKIVATLLSIRDGKRSRITRDDLCDHVWEFRFTESAPEYWRDLDPYWRGDGGTPMRRYFHPDGSITADADDKVWGGHESSYTIVTGLLADGKVREHYVRINRWPKMLVERHPDWSWVLRNHLYCYTGIRDADRPGGTGPAAPITGGESS